MISRAEFERITTGILEDSQTIIKHNPIGTNAEVLLWMLLSCLVSYLSVPEIETPCFTGRPDSKTYVEAITFILTKRKSEPFDETPYLERLMSV